MSGERVAVSECMNLQPEETALVVYDEAHERVADRLVTAASEIADTRRMTVEAGEHGAEPPAEVAEAMGSADVVLVATSGSLSHTDALYDALVEHGTRAASMPGITESMLDGAVATDYESIESSLDHLLPKLRSSSRVRVTAPAGTDVRLRVEDFQWLAEPGRCHEPGYMTNLPAGEVATGIDTADGTVVVDGSMAGLDSLDDPIEIQIEEGRAVDISDDRFADLLDSTGPCARSVGEFGIGLNPDASVVGNPLQDEKVKGTVHFGFGDDTGLGGDTDCEAHLDGIVTDATVALDGEPVSIK